MRGQRILLLALVGFISFLSGGWLLQRGTSRAGNIYQQARLFDDVVGYVADYYVDSVGVDELYDMAIDGLLDRLEDPYARFLRREDYEELTESTTGNYGGLGIRIDVRDGWITIIAPIAGTPAEAAGLETGDRIIAVAGESTFGWKSDQAVSVLRGKPGSEVEITIARPGLSESFQVTVARALIHINAIQLSTILGDDVGYISLVYSSISETLARELEDEVVRLREEGARSLILDVRNNPGGLLDAGVDVTDLFLDPGESVVDTKGRARGSSDSYRARQQQRWPDMPMVVLVNGGTASTPSGRTIQRPMDRQGLEALAVAQVEGPGSDTAAVDSSHVHRTDGGRVVIGGGGIRPDLVVPVDTLSEAEQGFLRALGSKLPMWRDVMTTYALEIKAAGTVTDTNFTVTAQMRAQLLKRLKEREIEVTDQQFRGAATLIDQQFAYEVQRYVFGRESESRRRISDDPQVQKALDLLHEARTQNELLTLAEREGTEVSRTP
jgi:carboxyl-terminal processing protease